MTAAISKSKASEALDILAPFLDQGLIPDEFTIAKCKRLAKSAIHSEPDLAYTVLGFISAMEWNEALVHEYFHKALMIATNAATHSNYGLALQLVEQPSLAATQVCLASDLAPTDLGLLKEAIKVTLFTGRFEKAQLLASTFESRALISHPDSHRITDICQILKQQEINQTHTEKCNEIASSFLREKKIRTPVFQASVDTEDQIVFFKIPLNLPFEQVYDLDAQLAQRLIEEMPDFSPGKYWLGLDCIEQQNAQASFNYEH